MKKHNNLVRKARRARCWLNGQERNEARKAETARREKANRELIAEGKLTPWQQAKAIRKARRAADPVVQKRAKAFRVS